MGKSKVIMIDCEPCTPRPDTYLPLVLEGTGIEVKEPESKMFGNWTWDYSEVDDKVWEDYNQIIGERLKKLYNEGRIRYAQW